MSIPDQARAPTPTPRPGLADPPQLCGAVPAPSASCPRETGPKPFHNTRQVARRTDGPFTQASRNKQGPARVRTWGQMDLRQGGAPLPGPSSPRLGEGGPGSANTTSDKQVSFHEPGGSDSEDGDDVNTLVTVTKAEQLTTPGRGSRLRCWAQEGQGPMAPRNPTGWHHMSSLGADWG